MDNQHKDAGEMLQHALMLRRFMGTRRTAVPSPHHVVVFSRRSVACSYIGFLTFNFAEFKPRSHPVMSPSIILGLDELLCMQAAAACYTRGMQYASLNTRTVVKQ